MMSLFIPLLPKWNAQYHFPFHELVRGFHLAPSTNVALFQMHQAHAVKITVCILSKLIV